MSHIVFKTYSKKKKKYVLFATVSHHQWCYFHIEPLFFLFVCVVLVDFYFGVCTFVLMPQPILFMRQVIAVPIRWIGPTYNKHIEYIEYIIFVVVVTAVARHAIRQCHLSVIESVSSLFCLLFNKCQWLVYPTAYRRNMFVSR